MADLLTIEAFFTLFMLVLLQAVLGFDNLLYIAIESNKVGDPKDAKKVRQYGIAIAVIFRIVLLFVIVSLFGFLAEPLFGLHIENLIEGDFTVQALVTLLGGGFIIYTAVKEIHHLLSVDHIEHSEGSGRRSIAKENHVENRRFSCTGGIQQESGVNSAPEISSPVSSKVSRTAADFARLKSSCPGASAASTRPPGKTQAPPNDLSCRFRRNKSVSRRPLTSRSSITVAAGIRGAVSALSITNVLAV